MWAMQRHPVELAFDANMTEEQADWLATTWVPLRSVAFHGCSTRERRIPETSVGLLGLRHMVLRELPPPSWDVTFLARSLCYDRGPPAQSVWQGRSVRTVYEPGDTLPRPLPALQVRLAL